MAPYEQFHIRLVIPPSHLKFKMLFSFLHWEMRLGCNYILGQKGATPSLRTIDRTQSAVDSGTGLSDSTLPVNSHCVCFSHIVSNSQSLNGPNTKIWHKRFWRQLLAEREDQAQQTVTVATQNYGKTSALEYYITL